MITVTFIVRYRNEYVKLHKTHIGAYFIDAGKSLMKISEEQAQLLINK